MKPLRDYRIYNLRFTMFQDYRNKIRGQRMKNTIYVGRISCHLQNRNINIQYQHIINEISLHRLEAFFKSASA